MEDPFAGVSNQKVANTIVTIFLELLQLFARPLVLITRVFFHRDMGERFFSEIQAMLCMALLGFTTSFSGMAGIRGIVVGVIWMLAFAYCMFEHFRVTVPYRYDKGIRWHSRSDGVPRLPAFNYWVQYGIVIAAAVVAFVFGLYVIGLVLLLSFYFSFMSDLAAAKQFWNSVLDQVDGQIEGEMLSEAIERRLSPAQAKGLRVTVPARASDEYRRQLARAVGRSARERSSPSAPDILSHQPAAPLVPHRQTEIAGPDRMAASGSAVPSTGTAPARTTRTEPKTATPSGEPTRSPLGIDELLAACNEAQATAPTVPALAERAGVTTQGDGSGAAAAASTLPSVGAGSSVGAQTPAVTDTQATTLAEPHSAPGTVPPANAPTADPTLENLSASTKVLSEASARLTESTKLLVAMPKPLSEPPQTDSAGTTVPTPETQGSGESRTTAPPHGILPHAGTPESRSSGDDAERESGPRARGGVTPTVTGNSKQPLPGGVPSEPSDARGLLDPAKIAALLHDMELPAVVLGKLPNCDGIPDDHAFRAPIIKRVMEELNRGFSTVQSYCLRLAQVNDEIEKEYPAGSVRDPMLADKLLQAKLTLSDRLLKANAYIMACGMKLIELRTRYDRLVGR